MDPLIQACAATRNMRVEGAASRPMGEQGA